VRRSTSAAIAGNGSVGTNLGRTGWQRNANVHPLKSSGDGGSRSPFGGQSGPVAGVPVLIDQTWDRSIQVSRV
jgi:hypothetical protein